jgi:RNA polymerase sigma factor (sigma-70 family)
MAKTVYRRDRQYVQDLAVCTLHMANGDEIGITGRRRAILRTLNQQVTPRQQQCLYLYYGRGLNQAAIAKLLGIDISTVSRNILHGERHVDATLALLE